MAMPTVCAVSKGCRVIASAPVLAVITLGPRWDRPATAFPAESAFPHGPEAIDYERVHAAVNTLPRATPRRSHPAAGGRRGRRVAGHRFAGAERQHPHRESGTERARPGGRHPAALCLARPGAGAGAGD